MFTFLPANDRNKLQDASINGINFLFLSVNKNFGNKLIQYELPSSGRYIDYNGILEDSFTVNGKIRYTEYDLLEKTLKSQKTITLNLPNGSSNIPVIFDKANNIEISRSNLGLVIFSIQFLKSTISTSEEIISIASTVSNLVSEVKKSKLDMFKNAFNATNNAIQFATAKVSEVTDTINQVINTVQTLPEQAYLLSSSIQTLRGSINRLINLPEELGNEFDFIMDTFNAAISTNDNLIDATLNLAGQTAPNEIQTSSQYIQEIDTAVNSIDSIFLASTLEGYANAILSKNFQTQQEISLELKNIILMQRYIKNINDDILRKNCEYLLNNILSYLNIQDVNSLSINEQEINGFISDEFIVYQIYGNLDKLEEFRKLNNLQDYGFVANQKVSYLL